MSDPKGPRTRGRRKAPPNTEWRGDTLWFRKRINGRLYRGTLRTSDVDIARSRAAEAIARLTDTAAGKRVRFEDMLVPWVQHIVHHVGAETLLRYETSLRQLKPWLQPLFLDEIDKAKIGEIIAARRVAAAARKRKLTNATLRRDLVALSSVQKFADVEDTAGAYLKKLKERRDPIVLPDHRHIARVIAAAPSALAPLIAAALATGCRLNELVTAERAGLDHARRQLTVRGKGNKLRVVDLDFAPPALRGGAAVPGYDTLRKLPPRLGCKWLFWHHDGETYRGASGAFHELVKYVLKEAMQEAKAAGHAEPDFRRFRFHDLRHRHAVDWLQSGRSIYDLQQRLGHTSVATTEIYLKYLAPEQKREVMYGAREESQKESPPKRFGQ